MKKSIVEAALQQRLGVLAGKHAGGRAQEARNTLAEQWRHIGKGPGQPPPASLHRAAAGQGDSSQDRAL